MSEREVADAAYVAKVKLEVLERHGDGKTNLKKSFHELVQLINAQSPKCTGRSKVPGGCLGQLNGLATRFAAYPPRASTVDEGERSR